MKTVLKFDEVVLTKVMNDKFKKVGEVFEIANILDNSFLLRDAKTKIALGVVSFEDFENYFVHKENFDGWTSWVPIVGYNGQTDIMYKTNRHKVIVKFLTSKVRAESCCHKDDKFNLAFGIQIAYLRCLNKANEKRMLELEAEYRKINGEIAENEHIMKQMLNSLGD